MKNHILITSFLLVFVSSNAQNQLDTIYANEHKNVALFFPEAISQGITGAGNFVFTYNREKQQYFGLLQAKPGNESNLLVIGAKGSVFSYIVTYKKQLSKLNYFIGKAESIGSEKPITHDTVKEDKPEKKLVGKEAYYRRFSSYLLSRKQRLGRLKKRKQGIVLRIENIVFDKEQLYFVIQVENKSSLDYDLNFLDLSIQTRKKGKKKSAQTLFKKPVFTYKLPVKIKEGQKVKMVYVFPKFSISRERRAVLKLNEKAGERDITLKVSHRFINHPN